MFWTKQEIAKRWKVSLSTVCRILKEEDIQLHAFGRSKRLKDSELLKFEKRSRVIKKGHGSS